MMKISKEMFWLSALTKPEDPTGLGNTFRTLKQFSLGAGAFAAQFGIRLEF